MTFAPYNPRAIFDGAPDASRYPRVRCFGWSTLRRGARSNVRLFDSLYDLARHCGDEVLSDDRAVLAAVPNNVRVWRCLGEAYSEAARATPLQAPSDDLVRTVRARLLRKSE